LKIDLFCGTCNLSPWLRTILVSQVACWYVGPCWIIVGVVQGSTDFQMWHGNQLITRYLVDVTKLFQLVYKLDSFHLQIYY
jgi:hypothetical protein